MRTPDPPYLELGFYFRQKSGREALRCLAAALITHFKAIPTNANAVNLTSASLCRDDEVVGNIVKTPTSSDLHRLLSDSSKFVRKIAFDKGTGIVQDAQELLVALPIESDGCESEGNVVAIWIEGAAFSRASKAEISKKEKRVAAKALAVFKKLIPELRPTYGAITVDYGLETPCDLRRDSRSLAFRDFYLNRIDFGEEFLKELRIKYPNCVYDELEEGQIALTTTAFRFAAGSETGGDDGYSISEFVARSIGKLLI